ncbi:hypothetical protein ACHAWF_003248 [Thalassiosira exigua]
MSTGEMAAKVEGLDSKITKDSPERSEDLSHNGSPVRSSGGSEVKKKTSEGSFIGSCDVPVCKVAIDEMSRGVVRSSSSPALCGALKSTKSGPGRRDRATEGCISLSDVTHVLFSSKERAATGDVLTSNQSRAKVTTSDDCKAVAKAPTDGDAPSDEKPGDAKKSDEESCRHQRIEELTVAQGNECQETNKKGKTERVSTQQKPKTTRPRMASNKTQRDAKLSNKEKRRTIADFATSTTTNSDAKLSNKEERKTISDFTTSATLSDGASTTAKPKKNVEKDLLSRFITYNDQRPVPATAKTPNRKYEQLPTQSPMIGKRLSVNKARQRENTQTTQASDDGVQSCSIRSSQQASSLHTPESQRQTALPNTPKPSKSGSPYLSPRNRSYPRSALPLVLDVLRIAVIMFSVATMVARCTMAFGGKMSIFHYMKLSPILWTVRWYMAVFHFVLIFIELDLSIPVIIPNKTLDNFIHRGYLISFMGLLDICMGSNNRSLVDILDELQGDLSDRGISIRCAFAVLGISSRGMIACGLIYVLLGLIGHSRETRRQLVGR